MSAKELPVIDLRLAKGTTRGALVKQLREALTDVGFIYLAGVDGCDEGELLRLTHWFFSLPIETRMKISKKSFNPASDYEYRGYFPVIQGEVSHKEEKIFYEDNQWPVDPSGDTTFTDYFRMTEASLELLRLISEGFDAPTEFFTPLFTPDHLSTLRLIHYPPRPHPPESARVGEVVIQTGEHRDSVMLTLLTTFKQYPGLQVRWKDDSILDVPHRPGLLVVNIGMVLAAISGVPFFLEPRYHGNINIVLPGGTPTLTTDPEEEVPYGPWIFNKITRFAEYKDLIK
ncbi:1-aminocyclopropane-1-carboxylate oxidase-like, partial [Homarus americanus]